MARQRRSELAALLMAVGWDVALGEPPNWLHPVAWIGTLIEQGMRRAPHQGRTRQLAFGAALTGGVVGLSWVAAATLLRLAGRVPGGRAVVAAVLLKASLSVRMLEDEARGVGRALAEHDPVGARAGLRALVSRDTATLAPPQLAAAAIESVAENAADGVVAPLLFLAAFGPAGAFAYRAANTLDAMIGYRGEYEHLGKAAARLDDLLNLVPSRVTALLLALAAPLGGGSPAEAWRIARRDHGRTASPNAGWPMAAMAGALGRELEKVGQYRLGEGGAPGPDDIGRALRVYRGAVALALLGSALWEWRRAA